MFLPGDITDEDDVADVPASLFQRRRGNTNNSATVHIADFCLEFIFSPTTSKFVNQLIDAGTTVAPAILAKHFLCCTIHLNYTILVIENKDAVANIGKDVVGDILQSNGKKAIFDDCREYETVMNHYPGMR